MDDDEPAPTTSLHGNIVHLNLPQNSHGWNNYDSQRASESSENVPNCGEGSASFHEWHPTAHILRGRYTRTPGTSPECHITFPAAH